MEKQITLDLSKETFPLKTLNGSSFDAMKEGLSELRIAMGKAGILLQACAPHPRDYPVEGTYEKALLQYQQHLDLLSDLETFYTDKMLHCIEQSDL